MEIMSKCKISATAAAEAMNALFLTLPDGSIFAKSKRPMAFVKAEKGLKM